MKFAIAAIVKDEFDSLEEWIAYHRALGADHFLLADNGSTDGTREYLLSLNDLPWVTFLDVITPPDQAPQLIAYERLKSECPDSIELIAFIDADEYILPLPSDEDRQLPIRQQMDEWMNKCFADENTNAVILNWACFGSSGHKFKKAGLVIERFQKRSKQSHGPNHHYKVIVRHTALDGMENPHHPILKSGYMVNAQAEPFEYFVSKTKGIRRGLSEDVLWEGARLNHYIVKSVEEFVLTKSRRGSASRPGRMKKADYFEQHDKNDESDSLILPLVKAVRSEIRKLEVHTEINRYIGDIEDTRHLGHRIEKVLFRRKKDIPTVIKECALDFPKSKEPATLVNGQILVQGWVLLIQEMEEFHDDARIVLHWANEFELKVPLDVKRSDVLEHFEMDTDESQSQYYCGFKAYIPVNIRKCSISLELGEIRWLIREVKIEPPLEIPMQNTMVHKGKNSFFFLQADSNQGVYQHRGQLLLTDVGLTAWEQYLNQIHQGAKAVGASYKVVIAPSKEAVMEDEYGEPRAVLTPIEQVTHLSNQIVYPARALKALGDSAYYKTDTHWTHRAAMAAFVEFLKAVGIDTLPVMALFNQDKYRTVENSGDLGRKLDPPVTQPVEVIDSFNNNSLRRYDNHLPNFGRIVVFENDKALIPSTLLMLGASSSAAMFNYAPRVFSRVVFAHTAGYWDEQLVEQVNPDLILLQTNGRFVIRPPLINFSVKEAIQQKVQEMDSTPESILEKRLIKKGLFPGTPLWTVWDEWLINCLGLSHKVDA